MSRSLCVLALLLAACAPVVLCRPLVDVAVKRAEDGGVVATLVDDKQVGRQLLSAPIVNVKVTLQGEFDESQIVAIQNAISKVLTDKGIQFDAVKYLGKTDIEGKRKLQQLTATLFVLEYEVLGLLDSVQANLAIITLSLLPIEAAVVNLLKAVIVAVVPILVSLLG